MPGGVFSRTRSAAALLVAVTSGCDGTSGHAAPEATHCGAVDARPAGAYRVLHGWPALSPGHVLGQVSGVAVDSHGHVFVFHRADHPWLTEPGTALITEAPLLRLERETGQIEVAFGRDLFIVPHGLRVDGRDHLWVTDVGLHQVMELGHDGEVLRTLGIRGEPGADANHFDQPTDVAVARDGTIFVADGYGNSRVVAFSAEGEYLREWGTRGTGPGQFDTPHSIVLDGEGRILVADRGNARVQRFDATGRYLDEWKRAELGRPWALAVAADGSVFLVDGGDQNPVPPDRARMLRLDPEGVVQDSWGSFGNQDGQLYWGHAIAVSSDDEVFVGDVRFGMRVQKFTRGAGDPR